MKAILDDLGMQAKINLRCDAKAARALTQRQGLSNRARSRQSERSKDRKTPRPQPVLFSLYEEEPGGKRPASLAEPPGPQERVQRHTMEQFVDVVSMVPSLAVPEPQVVTSWWP